MLAFLVFWFLTGHAIVVVAPESSVGRYQLVHDGGFLHLVDTSTGQIRSFIHGPETLAKKGMGSVVQYGPIAYTAISELPPVRSRE